MMSWGDIGPRGICRVCGEPARKKSAFYCEEHKHLIGSSAKQEEEPEGLSEVPVPPSAEPPPPGGSPWAEERPSTDPPKKASDRGGRSRLKDLLSGRKPEGGEKAPQTRERRPAKPAERRRSIADIASFVYGGAGALMVRTGSDIPVGRMMGYGAPVAGDVIDDALRGTWADKLLQPLVREQDRLEKLWDVLGPPLLVGVIERHPEMESMLGPILRETIRSQLARMAPIVARKRREAEKAAQAAREAFPELATMLDEHGQPVDPAELIYGTVFAPPDEPIDLSPVEEPTQAAV